MSTPFIPNTNVHTQDAVQPILDDITKSVEGILNSRAIELNDFLRQQHTEVMRVIDLKNAMLVQMGPIAKDKETERVIKELEKKFTKEKVKLDTAIDELKYRIIHIIREQSCEDGKYAMLNVPDLLSGFAKEVKKTATAIEIANEQQKERDMFSKMMEGFTNTFYRILDRAHKYAGNAVKEINDKLKAPVDYDYGVDAMYNDNLSVSSHRTKWTDYTSETGRLLDEAFQPGIGCITRTGIEQLQIGLNDIRDRVYQFIFNDILSDSGITISEKEQKMHNARLASGIPRGNINFGDNTQSSVGSQSTIATEYVPSPIASQSEDYVLDKIPSFYPPLPEDLRRTSSVPLEDPVPIMFSPRFNEELLSQKTDDPRFFSRPIVPGKITATKGRTARYHNPLEGKTRSKKGSPKGRSRANSRGGKKHRRRTAHKRKNV